MWAELKIIVWRAVSSLWKRPANEVLVPPTAPPPPPPPGTEAAKYDQAKYDSPDARYG